MFFYVTIAILVSLMIAPPLGSLMLHTYGPVLPFAAGIPFEILAYLILWLLPDTTHVVDMAKNGHSNVVAYAHQITQRRSIKDIIRAFRQPLKFIINNGSLVLPMLAFVSNKFLHQVFDLVLQYTSFRYDWSLAQVRVNELPSSVLAKASYSS